MIYSIDTSDVDTAENAPCNIQPTGLSRSAEGRLVTAGRTAPTMLQQTVCSSAFVAQIRASAASSLPPVGTWLFNFTNKKCIDSFLRKQ